VVSFCPEDDAAAGGAITAFLEDVAEEYSATFADITEFISDRTPAAWGQRDIWGEALRDGAPLVAFVSPNFANDDARVAEVLEISADTLDDPTGRVVLLPWQRVNEPEEEAIPTLSSIPADSELYGDAVRGVARWIRGVVEMLTQTRPAESELSLADTLHLPRLPMAQEHAFEARQYSRLSAQILHNAAILDKVTIAIFEGFEDVLGSDWTELTREGVCDLAVALSPRVAESKIATKTMVRAWKEARRILRHLHHTAEAHNFHPFRERLLAMLWDLADALDVRVDIQTLTELQFGAETPSDLRPAFRALLRNARARQRVRAGALACLAAVGELDLDSESLPEEDVIPADLRLPKKKKKDSPVP
jgi:hypothetical protein